MLDGGPVIRVRTVKRRMMSERWSAAHIAGIRATPRAPNPRDTKQEQPMHEGGTTGVHLGMDADGSKLPEAEAENQKPAFRDFKITKGILSRHGYSDDCPGCLAAVCGFHRLHNQACRTRLEALLRQEEYNDVLINRDTRFGRSKFEKRRISKKVSRKS